MLREIHGKCMVFVRLKKRYRIIERNENQPISCGNKLNITPKKIQEKKNKKQKTKNLCQIKLPLCLLHYFFFELKFS